MVEIRQTGVSISEQDIATLDTFAEKTLQATQISEVMMAEPTLVQRGAIYFISAALGLSSCLLYFGKVPVWVSTRGKIIPEAKDIPARVSKSSEVNTPLVVKATVLNKDIGFVKVGMAARIKVDTYPFGQFGSVPARVQQIVPDDSDNFIMTLELLQDFIKADDHKIQLFSGLTVQAEVQTKNQRLFELLFNQ